MTKSKDKASEDEIKTPQDAETVEGNSEHETILDAEVIEEQAEAIGENDHTSDTGEAQDDQSVSLEEAEESEDQNLGPNSETQADTVDDPSEAALHRADTSAPVETIVEKTRMMPVLIGALIAGAVGFFLAQFAQKSGLLGSGQSLESLRSEFEQKLGDVSASLDTVSQKTTGSESAMRDMSSNLADVQEQITGLSSELRASDQTGATVQSLTARVESMEQLVADMSQVIKELQKRPVAATLSSDVIDAYQAEVSSLMETMQARREEAESIMAQARAEKAQAAEIAQKTQAKALMSDITAALATGGNFSAALEEFASLTGIEIPSGLAAFSSGVVTLDQLLDDFPERARRALAADRSEETFDGSTQSLLGFLKSQVQARSVTPKEGDDTDAILSRAEHAVRNGDLDQALQELQTLPSEIAESFEGWIDSARARQTAIAEAQVLKMNLGQ